MRHYLATLHKRPHHHQKRFALITSGTFTLLIFGIWAMVNFPPSMADQPVVAESQKEVSEANPFGSLTRGMAASFESLKESFQGLKGGLQMIDFQDKFQELKENTLNNYGE
jgi:hypothetical protein